MIKRLNTLPFCFIMFFVSYQIVHHQSRFERKPLRKSYHGPTQQTKRSCLIPNKIENCQAKLFSSCPRLFLLEPMVKLVKVETLKSCTTCHLSQDFLEPTFPSMLRGVDNKTWAYDLACSEASLIITVLQFCLISHQKKHDKLSFFEKVTIVLLERGKKRGRSEL